MTTPARSPIADAAAAALTAWQQSEQRRQELIGKARTALAPVLPGVRLETLETTVHDGELVIVTDGVVHLGIRTDGQVWVVQRATGVGVPPGWQQVRQVRNGRELAEALPQEVLQGRRPARG